MTGDFGSRTHASLLGRLRTLPADEAAWKEFVSSYGRRIHSWCRQWKLQPADAENVTQAVLLKLVKAMRSFEYDPAKSFRAWLKTLVHHAWHDLAFARSPLAVAGDPRLTELLESLQARDDLAKRIEAAWDQEILDLAAASVRLRVLPVTWESFRLTAIENRTASEVALELGINLVSVYKARSNVQKLLQEEIRHLEGASPP